MNTIKEGSKDVATVKVWQGRIGVKDDGIFGPATTAATKAFQTAHGLKPDGVVGPNTWAASEKPKPAAKQVATTNAAQTAAKQVAAAKAPVPAAKQAATVASAATAVQKVQDQKAAAQPTPPKPPAATAAASSYPTLREGSNDTAAVMRWQEIINVKVDGAFGPATTAGTKVFQRAHGLEPDGVVGPKTWTAGLGAKAPTAKPTSPATVAQKKAETVNAAQTAASTIAAKKPSPSPAPPQTVREVVKVTEKIVRENAKKAKNAVASVKDKAVHHVRKQPPWLQVFGAGLVGLAGLITYKAVSEPKRRSA